MKRIRVVVWVVLVMAMLAMSAGPAAAGSKPTSALDPGLAGSKWTSVLEPSAQSIDNGGGSVGVQGVKTGYGGYGEQ
jgi:hypothetical protein